MKRFMKQLGQGMTEYIIIISLIAIAGIGAFSFFGDGMKEVIGTTTEELTGKDSTTTQSDKGDARISETRGMDDYNTGDL